MDLRAVRREALAWFRGRLVADAWLDEIRAQARPLKVVPATSTKRRISKRPRSKPTAA